MKHVLVRNGLCLRYLNNEKQNSQEWLGNDVLSYPSPLLYCCGAMICLVMRAYQSVQHPSLVGIYCSTVHVSEWQKVERVTQYCTRVSAPHYQNNNTRKHEPPEKINSHAVRSRPQLRYVSSIVDTTTNNGVLLVVDSHISQFFSQHPEKGHCVITIVLSPTVGRSQIYNKKVCWLCVCMCRRKIIRPIKLT